MFHLDGVFTIFMFFDGVNNKIVIGRFIDTENRVSISMIIVGLQFV